MLLLPVEDVLQKREVCTLRRYLRFGASGVSGQDVAVVPDRSHDRYRLAKESVRVGPLLSLLDEFSFSELFLDRQDANPGRFPTLVSAFQSSFSICYTASRARNSDIPLRSACFPLVKILAPSKYVCAPSVISRLENCCNGK